MCVKTKVYNVHALKKLFNICIIIYKLETIEVILKID